MSSIRYISVFMSVAVMLGCKKLVDVSPPITSITNTNVFNANATAISVMTNVYINMSQSQIINGGLTSMSVFPGLSSDELSVYGTSNTTCVAYYTNSLTSSNTGSTDFWSSIYPTIYISNSVIEGVKGSTGLTPAVKQQLLGEAEFIRAFCYFYLVSLYGDAPLVLTVDYSINGNLSRTPKAQVWSQIIADLKDAQGLLSANFVDGTLLNSTTERIRPSKWAAAALLARTYLYTGNWKDAQSQADSVINNNASFPLALDSNINNVFYADDTEAIWQLQPVVFGQNTQDAVLFVLPSSGPDGFSYPVVLNPLLVHSFEPGDLRRANWVDSVTIGDTSYFYAYKYKVNVNPSPVTEYEMVLRVAEQYLIRAEAEAQLGDLTNAATDLNIIRHRAGLPPVANSIAGSQGNLLGAIMHERQVELFTEWGHRWLDLKRTGGIDSVMGNPGNVCFAKSAKYWNGDWQWYPIVLSDLQADHNLVQNSGY